MTRLHALRRRDDGQAVVLCVLVLVVLLGIASLVVDGGNALLQRRNQQGVADAAALAPSSVCVIVHTNTKGAFSRLLGIDIWKEDARAIAQVSQVRAMSGWLPLGVRSAAFNDNPPAQLTITPGDGSHNVGGMINTPAGPDCKFYGGNQIADVIKGAAYGGADACPITIGQTVQTQTGVSTGNITTKGFDARIGSNTDSFSDVFGQDANGRYYVKKLDSPRLGVMPVAQDTGGSWPLAGNASIVVQGYVLVYIGDTTKPPSYPAYSGNGNGLKIYLTPVDVPLPDSWPAQVGDYSSSNPSPIVYRLVS